MPKRDVSPDLVRVLGELKLGRLLPVLPERLRQARERQMDPEDALLLVLSDEVQRRANQRLAMRADKARLAPELVFEEWDANARVTYDRNLLDDLRTLRFLDNHHHVLLMGPVGVGKTMLAHALGHEALRRDRTVIFEVADKMFARLKASRLDDTHEQELRRLTSVDLLIIDDLGLRAMDVLETNDLYEIVTARHRVASMIVTTNQTDYRSRGRSCRDRRSAYGWRGRAPSAGRLDPCAQQGSVPLRRSTMPIHPAPGLVPPRPPSAIRSI